MVLKGQNPKNNLVAKESYYIDNNVNAAFEDLNAPALNEWAEIDFAYDENNESLQEALKNSFDGYNVQYEVIQEHGPAGGWPVVKITGDRPMLEKWLRENYEPDGEDLDLYFRHPEEEEEDDLFNFEDEDVIKDERESEDPEAKEACACESSEEMAKFYMLIDEIQDDADFDNIRELIESARVDGEITDDEYNQLQIELANRK